VMSALRVGAVEQHCEVLGSGSQSGFLTLRRAQCVERQRDGTFGGARAPPLLVELVEKQHLPRATCDGMRCDEMR
jgi:hypothetical protein